MCFKRMKCYVWEIRTFVLDEWVFPFPFEPVNENEDVTWKCFLSSCFLTRKIIINYLKYFFFLISGLFHTDGQKLPGTMCDYQFISSNYSLTHGKFYSPRYPSSYPKNIKCAYRFRAKLKERIRIVFEEVALQKGDLR